MVVLTICLAYLDGYNMINVVTSVVSMDAILCCTMVQHGDDGHVDIAVK